MSKESTFWAEALKESLTKNRLNPAKHWELCVLIAYKYKLNIKTRGYSAAMIAYKILEIHEKELTKEEKDFLGGVIAE